VRRVRVDRRPALFGHRGCRIKTAGRIRNPTLNLTRRKPETIKIKIKSQETRIADA